MWITEWGAAASTAACTVWYWPLGPTVNSRSAGASEPANNKKVRIFMWQVLDRPGGLSYLANPRKLVAGEHIDDSGCAEGGLHRDHGGVLVGHGADDGGLAAKGVMAHGGEDGVGGVGRDDGDELALVGDIERV